MKEKMFKDAIESRFDNFARILKNQLLTIV